MKRYIDYILGPALTWFGRRGLHPIHLTLLSLPCGLIGVYYLYTKPVLGSLLVLCYFTLDFIDGSLARVTGKETEVGKRLDFLFDRLVACSFLVVYYLRTDEFILPFVGLTGIFAVSLEEAGLIKR